ncbi:MAG: DMT family transporter [Candidatus Rifleibacteriota bacterium]
MKLKDWFLLFVLSVIWGSSFIFIKIALREMTPFMIVFTRLILASVFLLLICKFRRLQFPTSAKSLLSLSFLGLINTVAPFFLISWSQQYIDTATASILNATSPIFVMILAQFFTEDEKLTANKFFGVLCGMAGIVVMVAPSMKDGFSIAKIGPIGVLCATFLYAVAGIYAKRFKEIPATMVSAISLLGGVIFMLPALIILDLPKFYQLCFNTYLSITFLGIFCTAVAYLIYFRIISSSGATNALLVTLLIPVSTFVLSVSILNEKIKSDDIKGMILIFVGLIIIDGRIIKFSAPGKRVWSKPA